MALRLNRERHAALREPGWLAVCLVLSCAMATAACGSKQATSTSPSPTSGGTCRTFASSATASVSVNGAVFATGLTLTGTFNASNRQFTATVVYPGGSVCTTAVFSYASVADFVDEVRVVPLLTLATQSTTTVGPACGSGTSTRLYSYDAQRRVTQFVQGGQTTTYSAWDAEGRPTTGAAANGTLSNTYDDATRTATLSTQAAGGTSSVRLTYDANGIELSELDTSGPVATTTTWTINATGQACK
jgi:YD repeat-containing protein